MVYTLAAQLIKSCPAGPSLPVTASSPLALSSGLPVGLANGGTEVALTYAKSSATASGDNIQAAVYNGFGAVLLPFKDGKVTLPKEIQGFSYIVLTNAADIASVTSESFTRNLPSAYGLANPSAANTVAGPAEVNTPFDFNQSNTGFMNPFGA
jgi:hypothetical protein